MAVISVTSRLEGGEEEEAACSRLIRTDRGISLNGSICIVKLISIDLPSAVMYSFVTKDDVTLPKQPQKKP